MPPRKRKACTLLSKVTPRVIEMDQRGFALVVSVGQGQAFIGNGGGEGEWRKGKLHLSCCAGASKPWHPLDIRAFCV